MLFYLDNFFIKKTFLQLLLVGIIGLLTQPVAAQTYLKEEYQKKEVSVHSYDKSGWENAIKDLDYSPKKKRKKKKKPDNDADDDDGINDGGGNYSRPDRGSLFSGAGSDFIKLFSFVILIGLLAFLIYKILGGKIFLSNKKIDANKKDAFDIKEVENNLQETELEQYITSSLASEDYKMAIRLYYLAVIKELSLLRLISWKKDKTNNQYIREMRKSTFFGDFKTLTRLFERVWYSNITLNQTTFDKIEPQFKNFLSDIKSN